MACIPLPHQRGPAPSRAIGDALTAWRPASNLVGIAVVDFLGRVHDGSIVVRVLTRQQYRALMAATTAINASLSLGQEFSLFYDSFGGYLE